MLPWHLETCFTRHRPSTPEGHRLAHSLRSRSLADTPGYLKTKFTASADTYVYADETTFQSDGTTYYRVIKA